MGSRRRKRSFSTSPAWAFPSAGEARKIEGVGWGVAGSAAVITESIPAGAGRVSADKGRGSSTAKGVPSPTPADEPPAALFSLAEIVDQPIEWVVEGVIPRGELTLITGEAGVGKTGFLGGLIANVTRGRSGPRDALCPEDSGSPADLGHADDRVGCKGSADSDTDPLANPREILADSPGTPDGIAPVTNAGPRRSSNAADPKPGAVVIFSTANMLADAVRPRLIEAGADLGKVYALCQREREQLERAPVGGTSRADGGRAAGTVQAGGMGSGRGDHLEAGHGRNDGSNGSSKIVADADSVANGSSLRPRMFQWHHDLPVLEAELARLRASGVAVSMMVIDAVDGYVHAPRRRSLVTADVEKLAELARKFRVAIVLAANVLPAAMLRANRPRGMAGIDAMSTVARSVWMIVRDLDVANGRRLVPIKKTRYMNPHGFAYGLSQGKIAWDEAPDGIQGEEFLRQAIMAPKDPLAREQQFENDRAANWLHARLRSGKVAAFELQTEAAENEIGEALLRRAFRSLGCQTNKVQEKGEKARWYWRLPDEVFF